MAQAETPPPCLLEQTQLPWAAISWQKQGARRCALSCLCWDRSMPEVGMGEAGMVEWDRILFGIWVILCSLSGSTGNSKPALLKGLSNQPVSPMNFSSQASALFAVNCVQSQEKSHSTCGGICMHCKGFEAGTVLWWFVLAAFRAQRPGWGTPARQTLTNGCPLQPLRDEASCLLLGR